MVFIYVLNLNNDKYYIGKTDNPMFRLNQHCKNNGSEWTKKYKPMNLVELVPNCDNYDEDKYTLKYMEIYGINNVRGGSFCKIVLSDANIITLNQIITSVKDKCYICGAQGHYANTCKTHSTLQNKIPTIDVNEKCDCPTSYISSHRRGKCVLNKVILYFDNESKNIDKLIVMDKPFSKTSLVADSQIEINPQPDNCDGFKEIVDMTKHVVENNSVKQPISRTCTKCGRNTHYASSCYAKTHITGYKI